MVLVIEPTLSWKGGEFAPVRVKALCARCKNCGRLMPCRAAAWSWHRGDRTDTVCTRCYGAAAIFRKGDPRSAMLERFIQGNADPPSAPD